MRRIKMILQFDGRAYHGWQVQKNTVTVQQMVQDAIEALTGVRSAVSGCSRTDAGVHAVGYVLVFDTEFNLNDDAFVTAMNRFLPRDMAAMSCETVSDDFHPRYNADSKQYVYKILNTPVRNPFWEHRAAHIRRPLDEVRMEQNGAALIGRHDFSAFRDINRNIPENPVRHLRELAVTRDGEVVTISLIGDGFLYHMARIIAGTLMDMELGLIPHSSTGDILAGRDRTAAGATAPANGLYLQQVFYPKQYM